MHIVVMDGDSVATVCKAEYAPDASFVFAAFCADGDWDKTGSTCVGTHAMLSFPSLH